MPPVGARKRRLPVKTGKWDARAIRRHAERGKEGADIAIALGLTSRLAEDKDLRQEFEQIIREAHAAFRMAVADRAYDAAVQKGQSTALIEVMRAWLARYMEDQLTPEEEAGLAERVNAELEKLKEARKRHAA